MKKEKNKIIKTNMGEIPVEDYCDIVAMQNEFDSYEDMKNQGYTINISETERRIIEKVRRKNMKKSILLIIISILTLFVGFYFGGYYNVYKFNIETKNINQPYSIESCYIDETGFINVELVNDEKIIVED